MASQRGRLPLQELRLVYAAARLQMRRIEELGVIDTQPGVRPLKNALERVKTHFGFEDPP